MLYCYSSMYAKRNPTDTQYLGPIVILILGNKNVMFQPIEEISLQWFLKYGYPAFLTKIWKRGKLFCWIKMNFYHLKWQRRTKTVTFIVNLILRNVPKHFSDLGFLKPVFWYEPKLTTYMLILIDLIGHYLPIISSGPYCKVSLFYSLHSHRQYHKAELGIRTIYILGQKEIVNQLFLFSPAQCVTC